MAIAPTSEITLYRCCPLDPKYAHTILFDNVEQQNNYFSRIKMFPAQPEEAILRMTQYTDVQYERHTSNKFTVYVHANNMENIPSYNYCRFKNVMFEDKWFYAFVTDFEYRGNNTVTFTYEIDVIQTFMFDYELCETIVERQHTEKDRFFETLSAENVSVGDYIVNGAYTFNLALDMVVVVITAKPVNFDKYTLKLKPGGHWWNIFDYDYGYDDGYYGETNIGDANIINGVVTSSSVYYFNLPTNNDTLVFSEEQRPKITINGKERGTTNEPIYNVYKCENMDYSSFYDLSALMNYIVTNGLETEILAMYQVPKSMLHAVNNQYTHTVGEYNSSLPTSLYGYTPKNRKLFQSPYTFLQVVSSDGISQNYYYELAFNSPVDYNENVQPQISLSLKGNPATSPSIIAYPRNYKGRVDNYPLGVIIKDFPVCTWRGDTFSQWWATSKNSLAFNQTFGAMQGALRTAMGITTSNIGGVMGGVLSGIGSLAGLEAQKADFINKPDNTYGAIQLDTLNVILGRFGYEIQNVCVTPDYAQRIDDYFTKYGYAINKLKTPNIKARPYFTFVKTTLCKIKSVNNKFLHSFYQDKICQIYDNGITFWRATNLFSRGYNIYDYSINNAPFNENTDSGLVQ